MNWFIQIENKRNNEKISVCDNGLVYGTKRNEKLFIIKPSAVDEIKKTINENVYSIKNLGGYYKQYQNDLILRIKCNTRKYRNVKMVGCPEARKIMTIILNESNCQKRL